MEPEASVDVLVLRSLTRSGTQFTLLCYREMSFFKLGFPGFAEGMQKVV